METKKIKEILDRYFEGNSSLEEEQVLKAYFSSADIDEEFIPFQPLFSSIEELNNDLNTVLDDDLMDFILESEHKEKNKLRYLWQSVSSIAAILLIALLVFNYQKEQSDWEDTYSDPNVAYIEANKTLQMVAQKYQLGIAQLQPVGKLTKAVTPLDKGLKSVNKGFREMENLQMINEKLKE